MLLASLHCIYKVIDFSRKGLEIDKNWLEKEANLKFNILWQKLAHLQNSTETAIIPTSNDNANENQVAKIFEVEIEKNLALLESYIKKQDARLSQEVWTIAKEFSELGKRLGLNNWKQLCDSIINFLELYPNLVVEISINALKTWQRARLLVIVGQENSIPTELKVQALALANKEPLTENFYCLPPVETSRLATPIEEIETDTNLRQASITPAVTPSMETNFEVQGPTVRVPVHHLNKLSEFIDDLSIERSSIEQNLEQLQNLAKTLNRRVQFLEQSNAQLRFAYDKSKITIQTKELLLENNGLDSSLEMEQYDEVDTLFQDVAETIVQIQEINPDLNTSLADVTQAVAKQKRSFK